jgi:transcriptional regulator with XRE-family HTH domain
VRIKRGLFYFFCIYFVLFFVFSHFFLPLAEGIVVFLSVKRRQPLDFGNVLLPYYIAKDFLSRGNIFLFAAFVKYVKFQGGSMDRKGMLLQEKYGQIRGSMAKLAKELGVQQGAISKWFTGSRNVGVDYLPKLAKIFGKPEAEIKEIFGYGKNFSQTEEQNISDGNIKNISNRKTQKINQNSSQNNDIEILKKDIEIIKLKIDKIYSKLKIK